VGLRSGVQYIFSNTYTGVKMIVETPTPVWINTETTVDNTMIPVMAGFSYVVPVSESKVNLRLDAYAGWALGYYFERTSYEGSPGVLALYSGGGFMADAGGALEFAIAPFILMSLNASYRYARTSDYKTVESVSVNIPGYGTYTVPTNDPFNDASGKPVAIDFSGFNIGAGFNIRI